MDDSVHLEALKPSIEAKNSSETAFSGRFGAGVYICPKVLFFGYV